MKTTIITEEGTYYVYWHLLHENAYSICSNQNQYVVTPIRRIEAFVTLHMWRVINRNYFILKNLLFKVTNYSRLPIKEHINISIPINIALSLVTFLLKIDSGDCFDNFVPSHYMVLWWTSNVKCQGKVRSFTSSAKLTWLFPHITGASCLMCDV